MIAGGKGVFSGTIPFGRLGTLIFASTKTKLASFRWFSLARQKRHSDCWPRRTALLTPPHAATAFQTIGLAFSGIFIKSAKRF